MKSNLINKLIVPLALFTGLGLAACKTPKGQAFSDFLGHTIADEVVRESIKKEMGHKDYREEENVYQGAQQRRNNNLPENVVWNGQKYRPAPGYTWVDPNNQNDLRVVKEAAIARKTEINVYQDNTLQQRKPQFFNAAKELPSGEYADIRDIFYPGETIYVVGNFNGGKITNFWLALDKNEQIPEDLVNGSDKVEIVFKGNYGGRAISEGRFDASSVLKDYGNNHRVYWLRNDKIVGYRDFVIMDKRPGE